MIGTRTVVLALLAYTVAVVVLQKKSVVSNVVLWFQSTGLVVDVAATIFMIIGSKNSAFTVHGFFGYSALLAMLVKTAFIWKTRKNKGAEGRVGAGLQAYSKFAYMWWVLAFIIGGLMVLLKKSIS